MIALLIILGCLAVIFFALFLYERKGIRQTAHQLEQLNLTNPDTPTNERLRILSPDASLEALNTSINTLLESKQALEVEHRRREKKIRQQIANISHDLRTPLTSILGYTQLLKEGSLSPSEHYEYLSIIENRSRTLQTLITGFYDLSRLEASEYPLECIPVNLHPILCELLASFYEDFSAHGLEPDIDLEENLPKIIGDTNAIIRIYTNLIQNALKHGNKQLIIRQFLKKKIIITTFSNYAPDLTQNDVASVFDRFFTADKMRTGQNTGLGLAIVKSLVYTQGHRLTAELSNDHLFTITIYWTVL